MKHKCSLPRIDRYPEKFKEQVEEVRVDNDPVSSLITKLVEELPYRVSIDKALAHPWLNPSVDDKDAALLFF